MTETLDQLITSLDKLEALSSAAITALVCIVVGYALKFIKRFPNDGIPLAVILTGAIVRILLADSREPTYSLRVWIFRNVFIGAIIGFGMWMLHYLAISKIEDYIARRFPDVGSTQFFKKGKDENTPIVKQDNPGSNG